MNIPDLLEKFSTLKIAVVGDALLDQYIIGSVNRISPEAPIPILEVEEKRTNPGGAANVVENLKGLGCQVSFFYNEKHVPEKIRVMAGSHHLLRIDNEKPPQWQRWDDIDIGLGYGIHHEKFNAVILSDYKKGMVSKEIADKVIELCGMKGIPVVVDSKRDLSLFEGATLVKCNHKEWSTYNKHGIPSFGWLDECCIKNAVITKGARGMQYCGYHGGLELSGNIPGIETQLVDSCGCGDTVISILACMIAIGEPVDAACELANIAAAEVCTRPGVYAIQKQDLLKYGK